MTVFIRDALTALFAVWYTTAETEEKNHEA
jgi:hypothetical protein